VTDLVTLVETAYRLELDTKSWLKALARATRPLMPKATKTMAWLYDARDANCMVMSEACATDGDEEQWILSPTPVLQHPAMVRRMVFGKGSVNTVSQLMSHDLYADWYALIGKPMGLKDTKTALHTDPDGFGVAVSGHLLEPQGMSRGAQRSWARVAAHLGAGYRLRRALDPVDAVRPFERVEAVIEADGRLQHAEGPAVTKTARDALRDAAKAADKARTQSVRAQPDEALQMWRGLVSGRWSLVDTFDSDGRRYWVAHPNEPRATDPRQLTERERRVATFAAMGHSQKLIGYELGLSPATVSRELKSALRKLGLSHRAELSRQFFAMWGGDDSS
jgi:DNA-binding CsgD family transcriptional regulator